VVENQLNTVQGRTIYPRYYDAGDGETFTDSVGYKSVDESWLVFQMVGQANQRFVFLRPSRPISFLMRLMSP
jgi:hypothetical protein